MKNTCSLCNTELTAMDTLLGANKLSDGGALCNQCLEKGSAVNQELLYKLNTFSIGDIRNMIEGRNVQHQDLTRKSEQYLPTLQEPVSQTISREVYRQRKRKIKSELEKLNASLSMFTKGEIKELPYLISEDEKIIAITDAQFVNTLDAGILVATAKRMLSVSKSMLGQAKINEYPNESIKTVSFVTDPRSPVIKLHLEERVVEFECYMDKEDAEKFYDVIRMIYNDPQKQNQNQNQNQSGRGKEVSSEMVFEQLEKLGKLRESGILTDAEFTEQKRKLLEQLR